eukprot:3324854-Rhodomonas_salina.1
MERAREAAPVRPSLTEIERSVSGNMEELQSWRSTIHLAASQVGTRTFLCACYGMSGTDLAYRAAPGRGQLYPTPDPSRAAHGRGGAWWARRAR